VGDLSTQKANATRRHLVEEIRLSLSEQYKQAGQRLGVVPEYEVQKVLHRRVLETFLLKQHNLVLKYCYSSLHKNALLTRRNLKVHTYIHTYIHAYIHTYIHTHIHVLYSVF
jgi:hypothetical protein